MESIQIKNLRSLEDTGYIELKPLTVLVGGNGSGKSTFLRFFPLMRQSYSRKINGPILWREGEKGLVDFGDYATAKNHGSDKESKIAFSICYRNNIGGAYYGSRHQNRQTQDICVSVEIANRGKNREDYVEMLGMSIGKQNIEILFSRKKNVIEQVSVNQESIEIKGKLEVTNSFIPKIKRNIISPSSIADYPNLKKIVENGLTTDANKYYLYEEAIDTMMQCSFNHTDVKKFMDEINKLVEGNKTSLNSAISITAEEYKELIGELCVWKLGDILRSVDAQIDGICENIHYITPLRANAERYVPANNLAVDEIDSKGENMGVFLKSMSDIKSFQDWTLKHFGFCANVSTTEGHLSVTIGADKKKQSSVNIADTGFGYSQILPIVAQLWTILEDSSRLRRSVNHYTIFTIEQPELHLHPGLQAKLIDLFAESIKIAKTKRIELKIIMETHSETMINRIGRDIYKDRLDHKDVNLVIFEKNDGKTHVYKSEYDAQGYVSNWPSGFFLPEED